MSDRREGQNPPPPPPDGYSQPGGGVGAAGPYAPQQPYGQQQYGAQQYGAQQYGEQSPYPGDDGAVAPPKTLSLLSMILGIVGVVLSFFYAIGLPFSIAAVVLGHLGKRREALPAKRLWATGLTTGYIGLGIALLWLIIGLIILVVILSQLPIAF